MKLVCAALFALMILPNTASAKIKGCYERTYPTAYLRNHATQFIAYVKIQVGIVGNSEGDEDMIWAKTEDTKNEFLDAMTCKQNGKSMNCKTDTSSGAGTLSLSESGAELIVTLNSKIRLYEPASGVEHSITISGEPEDKFYTLKRISEKNCIN